MKRIILTLLISAAFVLGLWGQEFAGISAALIKGGACGDYLMVSGVLENGPADKAGLMRGSCIFEVDGTDLKNLSLDEAVALIRGPVGTDVILTISEDRQKKLNITRQSVNQAAMDQQAQRRNGWVPVALHKSSACGDFYAIEDVLRGSSAEVAGLVTGNCIYAINDRAIDQLSATEVRGLLSGEAGTSVELTLNEDGSVRKRVMLQEYTEEDAERFSEQLKETRIAFGNKLTEEYMERAREERSGQIIQEYREALDAVFAGIDLLMKSAEHHFENMLSLVHYDPKATNMSWKTRESFEQQYRFSGNLNLKPLSPFYFSSNEVRLHPKFNWLAGEQESDYYHWLHGEIKNQLNARYVSRNIELREESENSNTDFSTFHVHVKGESGQYNNSSRLKISFNDMKMRIEVYSAFTRETDRLSAADERYDRQTRRKRGFYDFERRDATCLEGDCINGFSKMRIERRGEWDVYTYTGEMRDGLAHGKGKEETRLTSCQEGEFIRGEKNGMHRCKDLTTDRWMESKYNRGQWIPLPNPEHVYRPDPSRRSGGGSGTSSIANTALDRAVKEVTQIAVDEGYRLINRVDGNRHASDLYITRYGYEVRIVALANDVVGKSNLIIRNLNANVYQNVKFDEYFDEKRYYRRFYSDGVYHSIFGIHEANLYTVARLDISSWGYVDGARIVLLIFEKRR